MAEEDYQKLFVAVHKFQAGDSDAALGILKDFEKYLEGFYILLRGGQVNRLTYSHRLFLSAFVKVSGLSRSLRGGKPIAAAYVAAESAITTVSIQLRPIESEDLRHEIYEVFLSTLRRYKSRDGQNFIIPYIHKCFPYAMVRRIRSLIKDPLVNLASDKILSLESINEVHDKYADYSALMHHVSVKDVVKHMTISYEQSSSETDSDHLGGQWLHGENCSNEFDMLNYAERKLIKQFYYLQMTDAQIAEELGVSYNTAVRRRYHIEAKIKGKYVPPSCKWCNVEIPKTYIGRQPRQCDKCRKQRKMIYQKNSKTRQ